MRQILKGKKITWHHFSALEEKDFEILEREFKFHPLDFDDLRDPNELPKLDIYKYYLFGCFAVPVIDGESGRVQKFDLSIFIGPDYIVSVTRQPIDAVERFFARAKRSTGLRRELFSQTTGYFLYRLLDYIFRDSKVILHELSKKTQQIESSVYTKHNKETTMSLSLLRRDILFVRHIVDPQRIIISQLINVEREFVPNSLAVYFEDMKDTLDGMWVISENLKNIVDGLFDVNEAFLSHRTNEIIRILTILSVILMPPTLITGYYGMNINRLPFVEDIYIVSSIIAGSLIGFWILIMFLDRRR